MKNALLAAALAVPVLASAQNFVSNGSFETGTVGAPGSDWTLAEGNHVYSPAQIQYFPTHVGAAFGEDVPVDNAPSRSPDAVGEHGVYFVDDTAVQVMTSKTFVAPVTGLYMFGFDSYAPANGYSNPGNSSFSLQLGSGTIGGTVQTLLGTTWQTHNALVSLTGGESYSLMFTFSGGGPGLASDIVADRFYAMAVPEPGTYALMMAGLVGVGFVVNGRRRR